MSDKCTYCGGNHWRPDCEKIAKEQSVAMKERKRLANEVNLKVHEWAEKGKIRTMDFRLMPDYYHSSAAFDLLDVLIEHGYQPQLGYLYNDYRRPRLPH